MSNMTKEQAIDLIKRTYFTTEGPVAEALKELVPELSDNEDERIRKAIISGMQLSQVNGKTHFASQPIEKVISYLERQKPMTFSDAYAIVSKEGFVVIEKEDYEELCNLASETKTVYVDATKHPDWYSCSDSLGDALRHQEREQQRKQVEFLFDHYNKLYGDGKKEEKPKKKWSEKDEAMRRKTIERLNALNYHGIDSYLIKESVVWLENLPIDKPEWTKEDEENLDKVVDFVYKDYPNPVEKYKLKDWLYSRFMILSPEARGEWKNDSDKSYVERIKDIIQSYTLETPALRGVIAQSAADDYCKFLDTIPQRLFEKDKEMFAERNDGYKDAMDEIERRRKNHEAWTEEDEEMEDKIIQLFTDITHGWPNDGSKKAKEWFDKLKERI